ncbi:MAG TPA: hypothetical protein DEB39_04615 [Planctomycetaceae bacterium]|nr:hypothetical protein [Planctomycetaceae bacterium]
MLTIFHKQWWTRDCGGLEVMRLAVPMVISAGSISLMTFTDRVFLMWFHKDAMTASMQAGLFFWMLLSLPHATAAYTNTFVAQYNGCGHHERIGPVVWQGIFFSFLLMPFYFVVEPWIGLAFEMFGHDPFLAGMERSYLKIVLWSAGVSIASEAVASFFYGRGKMHVVMNVNLVCVFLNAGLDWCMIFGHMGFPAWGLEGAAVATVLSQWVRLMILLGLVAWENGRGDRFGFLRGCRFDFPLLGRLLYFGLASGVQVFSDATAFTIFVLLIGSESFAGSGLGKQAANASSIAFTLNMFTFLPIVGTGIAVTTLVGNRIGHKQPDLAQRATVTALVLAVVYSAFFGMIYLLAPGFLLQAFEIYAENPVEFEAIRPLTIHLLWFVALYLFFDALTIIFSSALKGAGDTTFVMITTCLIVPLLPVLSFAGIYFAGFGLYWCWSVLAGWVIIFAAVFWQRFRRGKWKKMQVIEREMIENQVLVENNCLY